MRCVVDTNVLVSAALVPDSKPYQALKLAIRRGKLLLSGPVLAELYEVLARERFRKYIDEDDVRAYLAALVRQAEWVDPGVKIRACRDPKDDKYLELAVSGSAAFLVTGDVDLIVLNPFQGIQIVTPQSFLSIPSFDPQP